jgi:Fe-S cluster assembly protein SufD
MMLDSPSAEKRQAIEELSAHHDEPSWLVEQRLKAWHLYEDMLQPTGKEEDWRRIDLSVLDVDNLQLFPGAVSSPVSLGRNGRNDYGGEIVLQDGVTVDRRLSESPQRQNVVFTDLHSATRQFPDDFRDHFMTEAVQPIAWKLVALHAALWQGGVFLRVPAGVEVALPLHALVSKSRGSESIFPHTLIVAEEGSSVTVIEERVSPKGRRTALSSGVVEILLRENARVRYVGVQDWGDNVNSFATIRAVLASNSHLELGILGTGGRVTKQDLGVVLAGPGAETKIVGLFLAGGEQQMNYTTLQDHVAPNTTSDLLFKSVLKDNARLVWNGLTRIRPDASESDANQTSRNLLLGEKARVAPIPVLEIEAHDVTRCSHGATVSSVDEEQLYYMMSRGLSRRVATQAIIEGFLRQGLGSLTLGQSAPGIVRDLERRLIAKAA